MIVKIENTFNGFLLFDEVEELDYNTKVLPDGKLTKEGTKVFPLANPDNTHKEIFVGGKPNYKEICFRQREKWFRIMTDRRIYIMGKDGQTIDKLI